MEEDLDRTQEFKNPTENTKEEFKDCWPPQEVLHWTHSMDYTRSHLSIPSNCFVPGIE